MTESELSKRSSSYWNRIVGDLRTSLGPKISWLRNHEGLIVLLTVFILYSTTALPLYSTNEKSHLALTRAIVLDHSFSLNSYTNQVGVDLSKLRDNYFSVMDPGESILLAPAFIVGTWLGGLLNPHFPSFGISGLATPGQVIACQLFSALCSSIAVVLVYKTCLSLGARRSSGIAASLIYAFGTLTWVFGKTLFAHSFSALFLMAVYYLVISRKTLSIRDSVLVGVASALALSVEYTNLVLLIPAAIYLLMSIRRDRVRIAAASAPVALSVLLLLGYNAICFGNPLIFPENYWLGNASQVVTVLERFSTPILTGLWGLLFSQSRGLLIFSPVLILAAPGLYVLSRRRKWEAFVLAGVFLCNLLTYSMWYAWNGGASYGPRFLVPTLPFLSIGIFTFVEALPKVRRRILQLLGGFLLLSLSIFSVSVASVGAVTYAVAGYTTNSFWQFLAKATGYPLIWRGTIQDLGFVAIVSCFRYLARLRGVLSPVFWVTMIGIPIVLLLLVLRRTWRVTSQIPQGSKAPVPPSPTIPSPTPVISSAPRLSLEQSKGWRLEAATVLTLIVASLLVRLPYAGSIPTPRTDELSEDQLALRVLSGARPLTNNAKFMGSFYQYILATFYWLFGANTGNARIMSVIFGTATIIITYLLAKEMFNRKTAFVASILLAFSVAHILIASHVGWSASLTPFFGVLTTYLVYRALQGGRKLLFLGAGISAGVTLQTHPSSVFLLAGLAVFTLLIYRRRHWDRLTSLKTGLTAAAGFTLGYANMIYYNMVNPLASLTFAENARWAGLSTVSFTDYFSRIVSLSAEYLRLLGDYMKVTLNFGVLLSDYKATLLLVLVLMGIGYSLLRHRDQDLMVPIILAAAWLILPVGVQGYAFPSPWGGHYVMLLLPFTYIAVAMPIEGLLEGLTLNDHRRLAAIGVYSLCALVAVLSSLWSLGLIYGLKL